MHIRAAETSDILTIQHLASLTWPETYADILSPRQMQYMLNKMYSAEVLEKQMTVEGHLFFMAENEKPVAFAGVSPYPYRLENQPGAVCWKLHKLYVLPYLQKSGLGKMLMEKVVATAKQAGATTLLLNVNRNNAAYHYYLKNGFSVVETDDFDIGAGFYMKDHVMAKDI